MSSSALLQLRQIISSFDLPNQNGIGRCRSIFWDDLNFVVWIAVYRFDGHNWPKRPYHVTAEEDLAARGLLHDVFFAIIVIMFCAAEMILVAVALQLI